ncbi:serine hydrolase domain-containing protein [Larkinella soli]|uniref:serine hydrolase domain-containing protein n=1 Tax=Larkinella soli TaxID=1770527 RepID=UPI0013E3DAC1|nr:serine hydrolase domain-containing protein [Larkinella soli]
MRRRQDIPGLSICVAASGQILWAQGFGFADLENRQPVTLQSKFRIGSVSKSLTSLAVGRLVEDHRLDLDAPIQRYLPDFLPKQYPITARQLATHTAGIRHYRENDPIACPIRYPTVQAGLTIFSADSLMSPPGTAYHYSTYGYSLLSAVIEGASGTDYLTFMQQAVFDQLGMRSTGADYADSLVSHRVRFYEHRQGRLVNAALVDNSYKWAGGGLLSTPVDLVKAGCALFSGTFLRPSTTALLLHPQVLANGTNTAYGLGWRIGADAQRRRMVHHGGSIDGGRTFLLVYPGEKLVVAVTANMSGVRINLPEVETIAHFFLAPPR